MDQIHGILDLDLGFKVYGLGLIIEDLQISMMFSPYLGCCTTERRTEPRLALSVPRQAGAGEKGVGTCELQSILLDSGWT